MKKKDIYFLSGVGIGIIIATIIFYMGLLTQPSKEVYYEPTRDEIVLKAGELGMVFPEDDTENTEEIDDEKEELPFIINQPKESNNEEINQEDETKVEEDTTQEDIIEEDTTVKEEDIVVENLTFTISAGESSNDVSKDLYNLGLIDDEEKFNNFLVRNGLDRVIRPKKYTVPSDITESEIILLITGKNVEYN